MVALSGVSAKETALLLTSPKEAPYPADHRREAKRILLMPWLLPHLPLPSSPRWNKSIFVGYHVRKGIPLKTRTGTRGQWRNLIGILKAKFLGLSRLPSQTSTFCFDRYTQTNHTRNTDQSSWIAIDHCRFSNTLIIYRIRGIYTIVVDGSACICGEK